MNTDQNCIILRQTFVLLTYTNEMNQKKTMKSFFEYINAKTETNKI